MNVKIDKKGKKLVMKATGNEQKLITLIAAFGGDMVLLTSSQKSFFERALGTGKFIDTLTIDLSHKDISKEFVQLMLRIAK